MARVQGSGEQRSAALRGDEKLVLEVERRWAGCVSNVHSMHSDITVLTPSLSFILSTAQNQNSGASQLPLYKDTRLLEAVKASKEGGAGGDDA